MKTKHVLIAMALPALFAACSADEFVNNEQPELGNRAKLDNVSFVADQAASTRFTYLDENLRWDFEANDAFSGFMVDNNAGTVTDDLRTNYLFKKDQASGAFKTTSLLVEGKYWFYAPALDTKTDKKPVMFSLPTVQDAQAYKEATKVFFSPVYTITAEDETKNIPLTFKQWFATGVIKVKNNTGSALDLSRIIITSKDAEGFVIGGEISPVELAAGNYTVTYKDGAWTANDKADMSKDFVVNGTEAKTPAIILNLTKKEGETVTYSTLAAGAEGTYYVALPQAGGLASVTIVDKNNKMVEVSGANLSESKINHASSYAVFGRNADKTEKVYSISRLNGTLSDTYLLSADDLAEFAAKANTLEKAATVYAYGDAAKITSEVVEGLNKTKKAITFETPMTISGKEIELTNDQAITFSEGLTVEEGTVLTVSTDNKTVIPATKKLINKGELILNHASLNFAGSIDNAGTLTVALAATVTKASTNTGIVNLSAALTATAGLTSTAGEVRVSGTTGVISTGNLNLQGGKLVYLKNATPATLAPVLTGAVKGTTIEVEAGATWNPSTAFTVAENVTLDNKGTIGGAGLTIAANAVANNSGVITPITTSALINNGTINNAGTIGNGVYNGTSATSALVNAGTVVMENSDASVTIMSGAGMVDNTAGGYVYNGVADAAKDHIIYVAPEGDLTNQIVLKNTYGKETCVNSIMVSGKWTINQELDVFVKGDDADDHGNRQFQNIVFADKASLNMLRVAALKANGKIIVNGNVKFVGEEMNKDAVEVADAAYNGTTAKLTLAGVTLKFTDMKAGNIDKIAFDTKNAAKLILSSTSAKEITMNDASYTAFAASKGNINLNTNITLKITNTTTPVVQAGASAAYTDLTNARITVDGNADTSTDQHSNMVQVYLQKGTDAAANKKYGWNADGQTTGEYNWGDVA